jgi:hypothetical protein
VAISTAIPGLDVTHTGFIEHRADGGVGIIHASPTGTVTPSADLQTDASRVQDTISSIIARSKMPLLKLKTESLP